MCVIFNAICSFFFSIAKESHIIITQLYDCAAEWSDKLISEAHETYAKLAIYFPIFFVRDLKQ